MSARPGSIAWLLSHELRLSWYTALAAGKPGTPRRANWRLLAAGAFVWLLLHAGAFFLLSKTGAAAGKAPPQLVIAVSAILLATFLFMLSSALKSSVETLFDRGDMDLLLSSPLPSRSIFSVKLAGMAFGVAALYLFFLAPLAHAGLVLGHFRWLAVYPVLFAMAVLAASLAMLLTLAMVRMLGARRTRVVAQVVGALAGALLFLLSQAGNLMAHDDGAAPSALAKVMSAATALDADSPLLLPARAALGEPAAALFMGALGLVAAVLTVRTTHGFFVRGLQQAAGSARVARRTGPVRYRFDRSFLLSLMVKEWRLVWRDPHLISQVLLQLLYLVPLCVLVFRKGELQLPAIAAGLTMLCGSLSASLSWIILLAEDAPDLLHSSPARTRTIHLAKLAAAVVPIGALVALPLLWLTLRSPVAGTVATVATSAAVLAAALIHLWAGRPSARDTFTRRGQSNSAATLLSLCGMLAWTALALLLTLAAGGAEVDLVFAGGLGAAAAIALGTPALAWLRRDSTRSGRARA